MFNFPSTELRARNPHVSQRHHYLISCFHFGLLIPKGSLYEIVNNQRRSVFSSKVVWELMLKSSTFLTLPPRSCWYSWSIWLDQLFVSAKSSKPQYSDAFEIIFPNLGFAIESGFLQGVEELSTQKNLIFRCRVPHQTNLTNHLHRLRYTNPYFIANKKVIALVALGSPLSFVEGGQLQLWNAI